MSDAASGAGQVKIGPILLAPGIKRRDAYFYLLTHGIMMCLSSFIGIIQPYVLTEILHIDRASQGALTGSLTGLQQGAVLIFLLLFGVFADRFGRRYFMIGSAVGMTATMLLYPLASGIMFLFVLRFLFGMSSAAHAAGANAMRMDIPDNRSRGKFSSVAGIINVSLAALFVSYLGARMPAWLMDRGYSAVDAGRYTFWLVAALGAIAIAGTVFGLRKDRPATTGEKHTIGGNFRHIWTSLSSVFAEAKVNKRFRMLLLLAPIVRCDSIILGSFLSLWIMNASHDQGLSSGDALRTVSTVAIVVSLSDIAANLLAGFLSDRFDRLKLLIACIALTAVAFTTPLWVTSVTGLTILAVVCFIQLVEGATSNAALSFLGETTPAHLRGSTSSVFSWIGQISGMIVAVGGGWLFDKAGYPAPFLIISGMATIWLLIAAIFFVRTGIQGKSGAKTA